MKTVNKLLMSVCILSAALMSCKDDDDAITLTTAERLQNKWQVETISSRYISPTRDTTASYSGVPADTYDFRANGDLIYSIFSSTDTIAYSILSNDYLLVDGDSTQIQTLTSNQLQIKTRRKFSDTSYSDITAKFKR